jgi:hypothetical protein
VSSKIEVQNQKLDSSRQKHLNRLKIIAALLTVTGLALFAYFIYTVGFDEVLEGIGKIGLAGFGLILFLYLSRITVRALAWKMSVLSPYKLKFIDTFQAVIIGEALSSVIPLGILASGTTKAVAVSNRVPLVVGFSSVATENLFYSLITGLFIVFGAIAFLFSFELESSWIWAIYVLIAGTFALIILGFLMVLQQWHWASELCESLYRRNIGRYFLENGRLHVRLFENIIYGFYRRHPKRFAPIILFQILYHAFGVAEIWFILSRISDLAPTFYSSFLLESASRIIVIIFKLIPFAIGVDEVGSHFISENLSLGVGVGITIAILRKGRILFWAIVGMILILKRGLSLKQLFQHHKLNENHNENSSPLSS